jgi:hypothetical protein
VTPPPIAVDFSSARPSVATLKAAGVVLVIRYLTGSGGKAITPLELAEYLLNGFVVVFVFEIGATDAEGGVAAGKANAKAALAAMTALDVYAPIYFAVDQSIAPASAENYFIGINSVLPSDQVGVYGEGALCELLQAAGLAQWYWQSESKSFPGNSTTLPISHLQQVFNASPVPGTDLDLILKADVGQFPRPTPPDPPTPTPAPPAPIHLKEKPVLIINDGKTQFLFFESGTKLAIPDGPDLEALATQVPGVPALTSEFVASIPNVG